MKLSELLRRNRAVAFSLCFLAFLAFAGRALADEADQTFFNANRLYEQGDYSGAVAEYKKVLGMGLESGNLYYNLGNAYFKMDSLPEAILSYRKALKLMPRDGDLEGNIRYAELSIKDSFSPPRANFFLRLLNRFTSSVAINDLAILSSLILILFWIIAVASLLLRKIREKLRKALIVVLVLFLFLASLTVYKLWREDFHEEGVIMKDRVEVRYSPTDDGTVAFNLHKGSTVRLIRRRNGWCQIGVPGGKSGWIRADSIESV